MKKILVATDFSACANNAMEYAMELAKTLSLQVHAVNVIGSMAGVHNNTYNAIFVDDYRKSLKGALEAWAHTYNSRDEYKDVSIITSLEIGSLSTCLKAYIEQNGINILVMGTMGTPGGITGLFGGNSKMMVEKTTVPELIIPLEGKFAASPVITLATDFVSTLSAEDMYALNELAAGLGVAKIKVVNVLEDGGWKTNPEGEEMLRKMLDKHTLEFYYISESNTAEGIINFAVSTNTDLLCLVHRHQNIIYRLFSSNTVNEVVEKSIKAVLVLHK